MDFDGGERWQLVGDFSGIDCVDAGEGGKERNGEMTREDESGQKVKGIISRDIGDA